MKELFFGYVLGVVAFGIVAFYYLNPRLHEYISACQEAHYKQIKLESCEKGGV